ncbi:MAG: hypothetical protein OSB10_09190 [Planctomycetota bacterium]|nr:hypothetical protein [Planctomycetota bacterium]
MSNAAPSFRQARSLLAWLKFSVFDPGEEARSLDPFDGKRTSDRGPQYPDLFGQLDVGRSLLRIVPAAIAEKQ